MLERVPEEFLPQFRLDWHDASAAWSISPELPSPEELVPFPISGGGSEVLFEIVPPSQALDQLWVSLATFARTNSVTVRCELLDAAQRVLTSVELLPADILDNAFNLALDLTGVEFQIGRKYWVRLSSAGATGGNCFAVWCHRTSAGKYNLVPRLVAFSNERLFAYQPDELRRSVKEPLSCLALFGGNGAYCPSTGTALRLLGSSFPNEVFKVLDVGAELDVSRLWPTLASADVVAFCDLDVERTVGGRAFDALCFALYRRGVCTIFVDANGIPARGAVPQLEFAGTLKADLDSKSVARSRCVFVLQADAPRLTHSDQPSNDIAAVEGARSNLLPTLVRNYRKQRLPRIAVVSVLYKKSDVIERFIDHVVNQSFPGEISIVLVDDRSPHNDAELARAYNERLVAQEVWNRRIHVYENDENLGNCASRLKGLGAVSADIFIVIDCDCLINPDFVAAHVFEHARDDVDVVIGPLNIESGNRDPVALVRELDIDEARVKLESMPQDPVQADGFLNCITRNFSAKRRLVRKEPLFDVDFAYSTKPGSGFGWEDVEMGYRIYASASVIRFTERAFSVHVSHDASVAESGKIVGSFRNFNRMFEKHPEMELVARRWSVDTYDKLMTWAANSRVDTGEVQQALSNRFEVPARSQRPLTLSYRPEARRLRILTYRWHAPHQYELYKLPHDFTLATHVGNNGMINAWSYEQRPLRENVRFVPMQEIDPRDFDLAIIHFDENILAPNLCNNVIPGSWGDAAEWLHGISDIPKVAICHGTPQFAGQYALNPKQLAEFEVHHDERLRLVRYFADAKVKVVCNSWQALEEWGFADSRVIWHGFDPQEFPPGTRTRDILALAPDKHRPHYRGAWEHAIIEARLDPALEIETAEHPGAALEMRHTNAYATRNFRSYVDRIRQFTAYLNTTLRSPMPRSRGEAMMTGVIPVALANHDVQRFIDPGKNGFYSNDPSELADWLNHLFRHPKEIVRISQAARHTAVDIFNHDRYLTNWTLLIEDALGERLRH